MTDTKGETTKVKCPTCGAEVVVDEKAQRAMFATCPKGHRVELVKMIE